ncbi:hypothetical protein J6590_079267 [Homalodisca vitripennis]|nr:hypothetical protein J6590_079267 [Homalodisca vitripennis]
MKFIFDDGRIVKITRFFRTFAIVQRDTQISNTTFRDLQPDLFFSVGDVRTDSETFGLAPVECEAPRTHYHYLRVRPALQCFGFCT